MPTLNVNVCRSRRACSGTRSSCARAASGAEALAICTDWNEFKQLDLQRVRARMARPIVVDGRNIYSPERMTSLGFVYRCIGRPESNGAEDGKRDGAIPVGDRA